MNIGRHLVGLMDELKYGFYLIQICLVLKELRAELKVWCLWTEIVWQTIIQIRLMNSVKFCDFMDNTFLNSYKSQYSNFKVMLVFIHDCITSLLFKVSREFYELKNNLKLSIEVYVIFLIISDGL